MEKHNPDDYRLTLLKFREELQAMVQERGEQARTVDLDQSKFGRLSRMDALQGQQMALESRRRAERKLQAIEGALRRLEAGDFGYCFVCGDEIAEDRLRFDPTITRCKSCVE